MKKEYSIWISLAALLTSIVAVGYVAFDCRPIEIDVFNTSISLLSAVVTIYVGIQIYNSIALRRDIRRMIDRMKEDVDKKEALFKNDMQAYVKDAVYKSERKSLINIFTLIADESYNEGNYKGCLYSLGFAIDIANQERLPNYAIEFCKTINDIKEKGFTCIVDKDFKMNMVKGILNTDYTGKDKPVLYINSFPEYSN